MQGVRDVLAALCDVTVTSRWIDCHTDVTGDFTQSFTPGFGGTSRTYVSEHP